MERPRRVGWQTFAAVSRWLHIYLSLFGLTAVVFFAVTGITLNHPAWFGLDRPIVTEVGGKMPERWLRPIAITGLNSEATPNESDPRSEVDQLAIVEYLRSTPRIRGLVSDFQIGDEECTVLFKGAGYSADVTIDRRNGTYRGAITQMGTVAIVNDLHKGRDTGVFWGIIIDLSAVLMILISLTGFVLIFFLKRKRVNGVLTAFVGTLLFAAAVFYCV